MNSPGSRRGVLVVIVMVTLSRLLPSCAAFQPIRRLAEQRQRRHVSCRPSAVADPNEDQYSSNVTQWDFEAPQGSRDVFIDRRSLISSVSRAATNLSLLLLLMMMMTTTAFVPDAALVANAAASTTANIKVTPVAHTFVANPGQAPKPTRENDAERFLTNARVVFLLQGNSGNDPGPLAVEVIELTKQRKAGSGPGVTPGEVCVLKSGSVDAVVKAAKQMPDGDVLLVGPLPSRGVATDGRLKADTAAALGSFVGSQTGGGVISVLLDGAQNNIKLVEDGYPTSELLWYSLP